MDMTNFYANHLRTHEIGADKETLMKIGRGISSIDASFEDDAEELEFYDLGGDLGGGKETIINGVTVAYSFTGLRAYGNEAQEFIRGKAFKPNNRDCYLKVTEPDGTIIEGEATIGVAKIHGGDAGSNAEFECAITFKGMPSESKGETSPPSGE